MAAIVTLTKKLTAAVVNVIAASQALAAAGNLALVSSPVVLDTQRRISILSSGDDSALVWTVYGTNDAGAAISEQVAGGNAVAVVTLQDFATVTQIAGNGATAGTVQVGTNSTGSTRWVLFDRQMKFPSVGIQLEFPDAAATASIETTMDSPLAPLVIYAGGTPAPPVPTPVGWAGLTGQMATAQGNINLPVAAWRLTVIAGTGTVIAKGVPQGISD